MRPQDILKLGLVFAVLFLADNSIAENTRSILCGSSCAQVIFNFGQPCSNTWADGCGPAPPPENFTSESTLFELCPNECPAVCDSPLTDQDFLNGRDIDMSGEPSDGRSFHEHGKANYQGDIDLTPEQYEVIVEGKPRGRSLQLIGHWPREGSVVNIPYIITACDFTDDEKAHLARAMEEYKNKTCLRFVPRKNETDFINIKRGPGCISRLGKTFGEQTLMLGGAIPNVTKGCLGNVGIPIHEFMHSIGYWHEQSRADRDKYITVNWDNIPNDPGVRFQFQKCGHCDSQNGPYDFNSIMHYGPKDWSINGQNTIDSKNGESFGYANGFSELDLKDINDFYCGKCVGDCAGCCNELEVSGLTTNANLSEGTYVKQNGTSRDRNYYKKVESGKPDLYIHWTMDGGIGRWIINLDLDDKTTSTQTTWAFDMVNNAPLPNSCDLVMGNKCPSVCGGTWKELRQINNVTIAWQQAPNISVTCKVNTAHCNNSVQDSDETDVDCGGVSCDACVTAIDGGWGEWTKWSKCNAKCPKTSGKQMRTRKCDNPVPENGGENCVGKKKEEKSCKIKCSSPCKETCKNKNKKCKTCKKNQCKKKPVQKKCPVTCNKCKSNGNKPCKDKWGAKKCKQQKKKCKTSANVRKNCAKTCKKCKK